MLQRLKNLVFSKQIVYSRGRGLLQIIACYSSSGSVLFNVAGFSKLCCTRDSLEVDGKVFLDEKIGGIAPVLLRVRDIRLFVFSRGCICLAGSPESPHIEII